MPICKLCLNPVDVLRCSHLIPRSTHVATKTGGKNVHVRLEPASVVINNQKDLSEPMLCGLCEERFSVFENVAITELRFVCKSAKANHTFSFDSIEPIVKFVHSVFWRASVSTMLVEYKLPSVTEESLRASLFTGNTICPPELNVTISLIPAFKKYGNKIIISPWAELILDRQISYFSVYGLLFRMIDPSSLYRDKVHSFDWSQREIKADVISPTEVSTIQAMLGDMRRQGRHL